MIYFGYYCNYLQMKMHISIVKDTDVPDFREYDIKDIVTQLYQLGDNIDDLKNAIGEMCRSLTNGRKERKAAAEKLEKLSGTSNIFLQYIIRRAFEDFDSADADFGNGKFTLTKFVNSLTLPLNIEKKRKKWETEITANIDRLTAAFVAVDKTAKNARYSARSYINGDIGYTVCDDTLEYFIADLFRGFKENQIYVKRCAICDKMFATAKSTVKYCSTECTSAARKESVQKARSADTVDPIRKECDRAINYLKNYDNWAREKLGIHNQAYTSFKEVFRLHKIAIREQRDIHTRNIERGKIDYDTALVRFTEFNEKEQKKFVKEYRDLLKENGWES